MVSLEQQRRRIVDCYDDLETPIYFEKQPESEQIAEEIATGQIFYEDAPQKLSLDDLLKAKTSLDAGLFQVHSLIEIIEMCKNTDISSYYTHHVPNTSGKFLAIKHLDTQRPIQMNWAQRLGLKYKAIQDSNQYITKKSESIKSNNKQQQKFMRVLQEVSKRWRICLQENLIFVIICKNNGEEVKVLIVKDSEFKLKVELPPEMKKLQILNVKVECDLIQMPDVVFESKSQFVDLEKAEQVLIDDEVMKEVQGKVGEAQEYVMHKVTRQCVEFCVNADEEIKIKVKLEMGNEFKPNGLFKNVLQRLHEQKKQDILAEFCRVISHVHIKMCAYKSIVLTLDQKKVKYRLKEIESQGKNIFRIYSESVKCKVADVEIVGNQIFCTSYTHFCINKFIPLNPRARIYLRELSSVISYVIDIQNEYLKLFLES